jgi:hypothetical protein
MCESNIFANYANLITSIATCILAIITGYYAKLIRDQLTVMQNQIQMMNKIYRKELITKNYDKLVQEMDLLIAPLWARKDNYIIFGIFSDIESDKETDLDTIQYYSFWENIKSKMHINPNIANLINYYFIAIGEYSNKKNQEQLKAIKRAKIELIKAIENRYEYLGKEILDIEKEFENEKNSIII